MMQQPCQQAAHIGAGLVKITMICKEFPIASTWFNKDDLHMKHPGAQLHIDW